MNKVANLVLVSILFFTTKLIAIDCPNLSTTEVKALLDTRRHNEWGLSRLTLINSDGLTVLSVRRRSQQANEVGKCVYDLKIKQISDEEKKIFIIINKTSVN